MLLRGRSRRPRRIVFAFPGGAGEATGARVLYRSEPAFRASVEACDEAARDLAGSRPISCTVGELLGGRDEEALRDRFWFRAVLLGVIQIATCDLWASVGVTPDATLSLSLGEFIAPYAAGAMAREETVAALLSLAWNLTSGQIVPGRLLALSLSAGSAQAVCEGGPESLHVIGSCSVAQSMLFTTAEDAPAAEAHLASQGLKPFAEVKTEYPWHTSRLGVTLDAYERDLSHLGPREPRIPMFSALRGGRVSHGSELGPEFFHGVAAQPFLFSEAIDAALEGGPAIFVNVGASADTLPWIGQNAQAAGAEVTLIETARGEETARVWRQSRRTLRRELRGRRRASQGTAVREIASA